ncbi:hypothetical protein [Haloferula rosea]|uniref:Uncharacterized protein n=1 Tax=Haloferula rosea TaxID=490093 RepID=A0A934REE2_9BACT|nr:hypothetical protein [Haloferula rosea]MBK1827591.1 hypothetical protein [Haloferula rosea]
MSSSTDARPFRVTVAGALGHGRQEVLEAVCRRFNAEPLAHYVGELRVWSAEIAAPNEAGDRRTLLMRCLDDACPYVAGQDLLVRQSDAVIFVFDVRHEHLEEGWRSLQRVAESAQRGGYDLRSKPLVLQYHRCDGHPGFQPSRMDGWLGLPPGEEVARVVTSASRPHGEGAVFNALWRQAGAGRLT